MMDETTGQSWGEPQVAGPQPTTVGYCQDCGKALTGETVRTVGSGVFCEPCLEARLNSGAVPPPPAGFPNTASAAPQGYGNAVPPASSSVPSPTVAGLLGFLPGVGAMYNGQFAKGIAHLAIFCLLMSLNDHLAVFGFLAMGWYFYMVFDAVYTARARRDGLPLPNPFHLNDIGERVAYGRWQSHPPAGSVQTPPPASNPAASSWQPVQPDAPAQANWAGYVPPTAFGGTPNAYQAAANAQAGYVPPAYSQPGVDPNNAWTTHSTVAGAYPPPVMPVDQPRRFPIAAVALIACGVLFLLANVIPGLHFSDSTTTALVLGIAAVATFYRRFSSMEQIRQTASITGQPYLLGLLRWPVMLATFSVMFLLQALGVRTVAQTWPILLIVFGGFAIAERMGASANAVPPNAWPVAPTTTNSTSIVPVSEPASAEKENVR